MRFAQIQDNKAHWVFEANVKPEFAPNIVLVDITDKPAVQEGWKYVDGKFIDPTPTLEELKEAKKAEIASARYEASSDTLEIAGKSYHIDSDARTAFLGTLAAFQTGALTETVWKLADGTFTTLDSAGFMAVITSVLEYIETCFSREKALIALTDAATSAEDLAGITWVV